jgi:site-specific recombinase XerD
MGEPGGAGQAADTSKPVTCQAFRHSFSTPLVEQGANMRRIQELLGHGNMKARKGLHPCAQQRTILSTKPR